MNPLQNFLDKFSDLLKNSKNIRTTVAAVISREASIPLTEADIEVKDMIVTVKASPMVKNTIFMRKRKILEALKQELGKRAPGDVR